MGQSADAPRGSPVRPQAADLSSVVRDAQRGSSDAFRTLYRHLQPRLLRYLYILVGDDAEDAAAQAWQQVARDMVTFTGDHDAFCGWVTAIGRHRALEHLRQQTCRPPSASAAAAGDLAQLAAADDTVPGAIEAVFTDAAIRVIATLPQYQAEAVLLRAVVGLDAKSAGRVMGKRAVAVRIAAYRGLRTLAMRLEGSSGTSADVSGRPG